jgi:hypothetical protein
MISFNIKDHISGNVTFLYYRKGELWYESDSGLKFPVPISDTGDGQFNSSDRAMIFMRYIRKHLENLKNELESASEQS